MKKLLMMMLCLSMFTGCSRNNTTANEPNRNQDTTYNETNDRNQSTVPNTTPNTTGDWYNRFESQMKNKNLTYSSKTSLDATPIGGAEGYRYVTENGNVDIYRFENGEDLNRIMKEKKVRLDNKDAKVEVNGNYIIVSEGLSNDVLDIFRGLK